MSENQRQPYKYRPLDRYRKEIRLIYVVNVAQINYLAEQINAEPEVSSDSERVRSLEEAFPVCCSIQHVSLEDKPAYTPLSYAWGDASKTRRLAVEENGKSFEL
jgi:antirestriction protein ArdC